MKTWRPKYWRKRAIAAETRNVLLRHEADCLRRDRDAYAGALAAERERTAALEERSRETANRASPEFARLRTELARLRDTVRLLDARNDELRRAVDRWETTHGPCERARQLVERDATDPAGEAS